MHIQILPHARTHPRRHKDATTIIAHKDETTIIARAHPQRHKNVTQPATPAPAKERAGLGSDVADLHTPPPPPPTSVASSSIISTRSPCKEEKMLCSENLYLYPQFVYVISTRSPFLKRKEKNVYVCRICIYTRNLCMSFPPARPAAFRFVVCCMQTLLRDARAGRGNGSGWRTAGKGGGRERERGRRAERTGR